MLRNSQGVLKKHTLFKSAGTAGMKGLIKGEAIESIAFVTVVPKESLKQGLMGLTWPAGPSGTSRLRGTKRQPRTEGKQRGQRHHGPARIKRRNFERSCSKTTMRVTRYA